MIRTYSHGTISWIDVTEPTAAEVKSLMDKYSLNVLVAEELLVPTVRPKVDFYKNYIYLILHFPTAPLKGIENTDKEIDFVLGKNFIITVRYGDDVRFHEFSKIFEVDSILDKSNMGEHAGFIFFYMLRHLYKTLDNSLADTGKTLEEIERGIFNGKEKEMVFALSKVARELLDFKKAMRLHREVLESLESPGIELFGREFSFNLKALIGEYFKVENAVLGDIETVRELRDTNNSMLSTKENEVMKTLTIMAFVTFPLTLIASIFGMNTKDLPIIGIPNDFWIVIGIMVAFMVAIFVFFKYKRWL